ncbi:MAG: hypothetical protein RLP44_26020 [Aggregatilineales bacterium]
MRSFLTKRDGFYLLLALGVVALYVITADGGFPLDDSWIHQVYARNLADLGEWSFIVGEPSGASTSPLYTVILAAGYVLNVPCALWAHLLGALALGISGIVAARLADRLLPYETFTSTITGVAVILSWHLIWAAAAGMETMIFSMFSLIVVYLLWRELDHLSQETSHVMLRGNVFGICVAMMTLTRPEGILLGGICGALLLIIRPHGSLKSAILWGLGAAIGFGVFISPYIILNLSLNGSVLPATSDAKYAQHAPLLETNYLLRLLSMTIPIIAGGQFILLPGVAYYVRRVWQQARADSRIWFYSVPFLWMIGLIALYAARLPAAYQHGRYVIPIVPLMVVIGVIGTVMMVRHFYNKTIPRVVSVTLAISAVFAFLYFGLALGADVYSTDVAIIDEEMVSSAQWIAVNLPENELLAVHDIGAVGYFAPRPILDIAGLISPDVVPIYHNADALWALMQDRDAQYLMAFPDQIPGDTTEDPRLCPIFQSAGRTSYNLGGPKMIVYRIDWSGNCP